MARAREFCGARCQIGGSAPVPAATSARRLGAIRVVAVLPSTGRWVKLNQEMFQVYEVIYRLIEGGKILTNTANSVGGPQGKILELSYPPVDTPRSIRMVILPTKKKRRYSISR